MCRGPQEWTTETLEDHIVSIEEWLQDPTKHFRSKRDQQMWEGRLDGYRAILKERAEAGTI